MKPVKEGFFPARPYMVLLTAEYLSVSHPIMRADFRDTEAIYHPPSGRFLGFNQDGLMLLGGKDLILVNGLWYLEEDAEVITKFADMSMSQMILYPIE